MSCAGCSASLPTLAICVRSCIFCMLPRAGRHIFLFSVVATSGEPCGDKAASSQAVLAIRRTSSHGRDNGQPFSSLQLPDSVTYFMICSQCIAMFLAKAAAKGA